MKRNTFLKSLLIIPIAFAGIVLFQGKADAEDLLEVTKRPETPEAPASQKAKRIIQSKGFFL